MPQKAFEGGILHMRAYAIFPEMPQNRTYSQNRTFTYNIFEHIPKSNIKKWGISRKKHVIDLKTRKEPKINMFDFGAFQEKLHMLSRAKYLLQRLFGVFHDTPRIRYDRESQICERYFLLPGFKSRRHPRPSSNKMSSIMRNR